MILVGMLDSPFVRRVAVTLHIYGLGFERRVLSVFADFDAMLELNPLGKVPVLELADGERLFDSRAILDYLDGLVPPERRLVPLDEPQRRRVLRIDAVATGLAEKVYERNIEARRPPDKRDPAFSIRVERQIAAALQGLEALAPPRWFAGERMTRADVTAAIALTYLREKQPALLPPGRHPALERHCARCEALPPFRAAPYSGAEAAASAAR